MAKAAFWVVTFAALGLLLGGDPLGAQGTSEPDPCDGTTTQTDLRSCWVRETEHAELKLKKVYEAVLAKLPSDGRERLKKAQEIWLDFRDAHLNTLYRESNRARDPYQWTCLLITRWQLTQTRTRQLEELLRPGDAGCSR